MEAGVGGLAVGAGDGAGVTGVVAVADTMRAEAPVALAKLRAMGLDVWMATGDNPRTAHAIAQQVSSCQAEIKI